MKKKSILFLLLMGLCLPWAANAQEQNMLNGDAADNGGRGTMRIYKKVSELTSGKNYLIVSSQTANSNAYALSQTSSSLTSSPVHINAGDQFCSTVYINSEGLEPTAVWKANSGWTFSHQKGNATNYLYCNRGTLGTNVTLQANTSSQNWNYSNNTLYWHYPGTTIPFIGTIGEADYYLKYDNGFTVGTGSANVYLYEETDLTVFDIAATASPSGIGTVTGAGRYLSGATCELTASSNNSEFAFTNWTMNGTVVTTANPYSFTVRADQNLVANFESTVSCLSPTDAAVINQSITAHAAALNWTENGEASQWQVVYSTDSNFDPDGATPTLVSNNPYTITGLAQSTTYYAYVRAYCDANNQSAWSNQVTFSTIAGNQPPTNLTLGTPEAHGITLSWTGVATNTNHQNFEVYYSTINIVPSDDIASGYEVVNANSCTLSDLTPETTYYAWVRDNCGTDGKSAWVAFNPFTTGIACFAPTSLTVSNGSVTARTATLTWAENGSATNWVVEYATNNSFTEALTQEVNTNPTTQLTGLTPETTYFARVKAICGGIDGESSYSNTMSFTTEVACPTPTNLATTNGSVTPHTATLTWAENGSATNWVVEYATNNSFTEALTQEVNINPTTQLTGLIPETTYFARVKAICGGIDGESLYSNTVSFTTGIACFAPTNVTASNVTNNSAVVSWTGEAESFNLRYGTIEGFKYGFEDAEPWNYTNFSPCTVYDGDGYGTGAINNVTFENQHYTGAFIAFQNGVTANADSHGGDAFGACFYATTAPNNDYFILPAITIENGYVFRFWAKSYSSSYLESFRAGVYNGNGNLTTVLGSITNVPNAWTAYTYDLSSYAGQTIQLAINCNSNDKFAFFIDDIFVGNPNPTWSEPITGVTSPYTLTGLDGYTDYEVQVQGNCGSFDGLSQWSSTTFQTLDDCTVPFSQSTTDITPSGATLNWDGLQSNYNVRYRIAYNSREQTTESFSGYTAVDYDDTGVLPTGWKGYSSGTLPHISNNSKLGTSHDIISMGGGQGGSDNFLYMYSNGTSPYTSYTILPKISHLISVSFDYAFENASNGTLSVGYCTGNTSGSSFVAFNDVTMNATTSNTHITLTANDIATINQHDGYLAFRWVCQSTSSWFSTTNYGVAIDNVTLEYAYTDSEWTTETNVTSPLAINGLIHSGEYEWQVQGVDCDGNGGTTEWSASTIFTTLAAYVKHINPYTSDGGYYLIASPVGQINPSEVGGMLDNDYDLYYFDQTQDMEWINYKAGEGSSNAGFDLVPGKGYLYANSGNNGEGVDLVFARTAYTGSGDVTLTLKTGTEFEGINLVGNPFADTAYIDRDFYRLDYGGAEVMTEASSGAIEPMEGVFVYAQSDDETMTFTTTNPGKKASRLVLNLTNDNEVVDRAMVRFGEGRMLPKFQLNENSTKVYMTVEGKEYAVVYSDEMGQVPVGFKAETNGRYTFDFSSEEVSLSYLHLIDNMNGNDIDLLQTPSYSFDAKTTDYENRFKLVFATGNNDNDDNFAFFSNGSFVINNEGEATLQVIDINGRILKSESINGSANVNVKAAAGVYMLRLVNGNDVKVQKVVVR